MALKRFLLFTGYDYYPSGGWDDFVSSFDTESDAIEYLEGGTHAYEWAQIFDSITNELIRADKTSSRIVRVKR